MKIVIAIEARKNRYSQISWSFRPTGTDSLRERELGSSNFLLPSKWLFFHSIFLLTLNYRGPQKLTIIIGKNICKIHLIYRFSLRRARISLRKVELFIN